MNGFRQELAIFEFADTVDLFETPFSKRRYLSVFS